MAEVVKELCEVLKDAGVPVSYDARHDVCKVRKGDLTVTSDGDTLIIRNRKDTLFIVPGVKSPVRGVDLARGENVVQLASSVGTLVISAPATGSKYVRVAIELDVDKDGDVDGGAYRTFY